MWREGCRASPMTRSTLIVRPALALRLVPHRNAHLVFALSLFPLHHHLPHHHSSLRTASLKPKRVRKGIRIIKLRGFTGAEVLDWLTDRYPQHAPDRAAALDVATQLYGLGTFQGLFPAKADDALVDSKSYIYRFSKLLDRLHITGTIGGAIARPSGEGGGAAGRAGRKKPKRRLIGRTSSAAIMGGLRRVLGRGSSSRSSSGSLPDP